MKNVIDHETVEMGGVKVRVAQDAQRRLMAQVDFTGLQAHFWADTEYRLGADAVVSPSVMALVAKLIGELLTDAKVVSAAHKHLFFDKSAGC